MKRLDLATILIVGVCLAALVYLIIKAVELYSGPKEPVVTEEPDSYYDNEYDDVYADADSLSEANTLQDNLTYDDVTSNEEDEKDGDVDDYSLDDGSDLNQGKEEETEEYDNSDSNTDRISTTTSLSDEGGDYLVIAGSYQQKINAENQVRKLRSMGYDDARVATFNSGAYAVALVDRFENISGARSLKSELANKGVDAFIKEKN